MTHYVEEEIVQPACKIVKDNSFIFSAFVGLNCYRIEWKNPRRDIHLNFAHRDTKIREISKGRVVTKCTVF
jgi:hypothetical protein